MTTSTQAPVEASQAGFKPKVPKTLEETGLNIVTVEDLILKTILAGGALPGRSIAQIIALHFNIVEPILADMKQRMLLGHKDTHGVGDFIYLLSDEGREKALLAREQSSYVGPAPVPFDAYLKSVSAQTITTEKPGVTELKDAFSDLMLPAEMFDTLGPAINSGRGLFLYGAPGNGKTSIAERISRCFKQEVYIPHTVLIEGQIVMLYDPNCHEKIEPETESLLLQYDPRWVEIQRPVIVVGGELTMDALEIQFNERIGLSEAPLQMKANCGVFLIDDFGRQRMHHDELLNRWIVPLEKRVDFLMLSNGKKIEVPFDELIIFSTNLDPSDLVDDAFLRRIPYKIHVGDPSEEEFRKLFHFMAPRYEIEVKDDMLDYLVKTHYVGKRAFRCCHARDILEQIVNTSTYQRCPPEMNQSNLDMACHNYFAAMENSEDVSGNPDG